MKGFVVLFFVLLTGCAGTETISIDYVPTASATTVIPGASETRLNVVVSDVRTTDRVASKLNAYGDQGAIYTSQSVPVLVKKALESELASRGFQVSGGETHVICEIYDFGNEFQSGMWSGTSIANIRMNIKIKDSTGYYVFSEMVVGQGKKEKIQIASGKHAKPALEEALKNAMASLFQRRDFYDALARAREHGGAPSM